MGETAKAAGVAGVAYANKPDAVIEDLAELRPASVSGPWLRSWHSRG